VFAMNSCHDPLSLHDPVFNDSTDPVYIMDLISDQCQSTDNWIENIAIKEALDKLPPREKEILEARFFEGKTQLEIAGEIGISQAQVSRLEKAALRFLRQRYYLEQQEQKEREEGGYEWNRNKMGEQE
ncbi:MAG: sigma-70 family RNA polymerase sigma factor, partial [Firmicutes bacterium]|nr:sigma-70 family RNA polymerase sigma factor [Bacillota bacterium]